MFASLAFPDTAGEENNRSIIAKSARQTKIHHQTTSTITTNSLSPSAIAQITNNNHSCCEAVKEDDDFRINILIQ